MVKGVSRRIVVVRAPEQNIFEEAIFILRDDALALLLSKPNVVLTSHQAFLTDEALREIARVTYENLDAFFAGKPMENIVRAGG